MILYHLDKWKYRKTWPPEGTIHAEGMWNKPGQWLIYTSPTISLAKLEILANVNNLPIKRVCMTIEVQDGLKIFKVKLSELPLDWNKKPHPIHLNKYTEEFLKSDSIVMQVPSAQSYTESNFLINVRHPKFNNLVKRLNVVDEPFDSRLFA